MSVSLLPGIIRAAIVRVNAVMAVWTPLTVVPRSLAMLLMATFMVVAAKLHRNCASTRGNSRAPAAAAAAGAFVAGLVSSLRPVDMDRRLLFPMSWLVLQLNA